MKAYQPRSNHRNEHIPFLNHDHSNSRVRYRRYAGQVDDAVLARISQAYLDSVGLDYIISPEDIARSLKYMEHFTPDHNLVIAETHSQPVGMALVNWFEESDGARLYRFILRTTPEGVDLGADEDLLGFCEGRLGQLARRHRNNMPKFYTTGTTATDAKRANMLEQRGYQHERFFFEMVRPLKEDIPSAPLPAGIELKPVDPDDYRRVLDALDEAFQDHWGHVPLTESAIQWWMESREFQPHLWKVAWDGDEVVGMVLNYIDYAENERFGRKRGYTEDICVRRPWRRRGIARALIALSLKEHREQGMDEAALGVDTQNLSGALTLYQNLGYNEIRKSITYRKKIEG
jgi:ribosomal protein S18 acetylase RimI-like enzyme